MRKLTRTDSGPVAASPGVDGATVTECSHCGWRGPVAACGHDEACLPVEGRCPFCRQVFTCVDADRHGTSDPLGDWIATKLDALRTTRIDA